MRAAAANAPSCCSSAPRGISSRATISSAPRRWCSTICRGRISRTAISRASPPASAARCSIPSRSSWRRSACNRRTEGPPQPNKATLRVYPTCFYNGLAMTADLAHVLVVDDDARLRELLRRYLTENGFRVATAANAGEARLRMADLAFDLIVLDVMMPAESGLELTHDLRRTTQIPILLLTAMGEVDDRIKGLESGADDYLAKPFEPRELVLRLRTI